MSRPFCKQCQRPQVSCICHLFTSIENDVHVVILQHPSEEKQTKGTVTLLSQSLKHCDVFIGEDFTNHLPFQHILNKYEQHIALLYPSEKAFILEEETRNLNKPHHIKCLVLLDGTWKKAFRLYMLNSCLQNMPHCKLPENIKGNYLIRKTSVVGGLSSLEACCYALSFIENENSRYQTIFEGFEAFNQMQLSFIPDKHK